MGDENIKIINEFKGCPFCMDAVTGDQLECCGQSREEFETIYEFDNGDLVRASEYKGDA